MMKILCVAFSLLALAGTSAFSAEPLSSNDLLRQGYEPVAAGRLTMKRIFVVVPRWTGFATRQDEILSMSGEGEVPTGELEAILARYGAFLRLARGADEYVCVIYKADTCYRVD